MKTIDIFIKSYSKDFWLLHVCIMTIQRYVTGYRNIVLVIPEHEKDLFDTRGLPENTLIHYVNDQSHDGWLHQQWFKMSAHRYTDADYILFGDSDCIFTYPLDLQPFVQDGRPEILYTSWDKVDAAICWKRPTEIFMKEPVPYEFMRRNCMIYHRQTLVDIEAYCPQLEQMIMNSKIRFSEFNAMGAFAYKYHSEKYNFVNTDNWNYTEPKAIQVWSWADKNGDIGHKNEYIRILETILMAFGIKIPT